MTTIKKHISKRSLPSFIHEDYPLFVSFVESFVEFMETEKGAVDIVKNLKEYRDIDTTLEEFVDRLTDEYMAGIPKEILADKRLVAKHINEFYANKGNEASYRFLFQLLYGDNIEFYYPKLDILRASDGKWDEPISVKILLENAKDLFKFESNKITGYTSGSTAIVESAFLITERNLNVVELSLSSINGLFLPDEDITIIYDGVTYAFPLLEIFTHINVLEGGSGYRIDDIIPVLDIDDKEIAKAEVVSVTLGSVTDLSVDTAGFGYNGELRKVVTFGELTAEATFNGDLLNTVILDGSDSASSGEDYFDYTFDQTITSVDVPSVGDKIFVFDDDTGLGANAEGIISVVSETGNILEVVLTRKGDGYSAPIAFIQTETGQDGVVGVVGGAGSIKTMRLSNFPIVLNTDKDSNEEFTHVTIDFSGVGDENAEASLDSGVMGFYRGRFLNDDGWLSSAKYLQDNRYYQDFSYVLKTSLPINRYRDIIKKIVHPAGLAMFGEISILDSIDNNANIVYNFITIFSISSVTNNADIYDSYVKFFDAGQPVLDSDGNHLPDYMRDSNNIHI